MEKLTKKALKEQYKNRIIIGGVYRIQCSGNHAAWLRATTDLQGSRNRLEFSVSIDSCPEMCMMQAWKTYGASAFTFETLEELQKKETQTQREFSDDIQVLLELWIEKQKS